MVEAALDLGIPMEVIVEDMETELGMTLRSGKRLLRKKFKRPTPY